MSASLRYVLLLQRDLPRAVRFYAEGLGLPVRRQGGLLSSAVDAPPFFPSGGDEHRFFCLGRD